MRIWLKPDRLAALNISPSQVSAALAANNHLSALGNTKGNLVQVALTANTDLRSVEEFKNLVIRQQNNAIVRIRDIADVELGAEDYETDVKLSGRDGGVHGHLRPADRQLARRDQAPCAWRWSRSRRTCPAACRPSVAYDATAYINDAIHEVFHTLGDTLLIVVIVIFLFLGSIRSVLIPVVAIPLSLIGAIFLMQVFGFTINLLTLLAIVLSVGLWSTTRSSSSRTSSGTWPRG
jgi:multidrug efflux pump